MTSPTTMKAVPSFRMTLEEYKKMESQLPIPKVSREDTVQSAAQLVGVQLVLKYIRDHYLVT